jgi:hypothetical protein
LASITTLLFSFPSFLIQTIPSCTCRLTFAYRFKPKEIKPYNRIPSYIGKSIYSTIKPYRI